MIGYGGVYADVEAAKSDFEEIKTAHREGRIGFYDAALFEKTAEGKVKVLDTDATQRGEGAKAGALIGGIFGLIFPPSILISAGLGAAAGAAAGNIVKGFTSGDIKHLADGLEPGEAGIILVASATPEAAPDELMKRATKVATQHVAADSDEVDAPADEA
jgi:uncharacterized membrane protein